MRFVVALMLFLVAPAFAGTSGSKVISASGDFSALYSAGSCIANPLQTIVSYACPAGYVRTSMFTDGASSELRVVCTSTLGAQSMLRIGGYMSCDPGVPVAEPAQTTLETDQINAIKSLWPGAILLLSTAFGLSYIRRYVISWHKAGSEES